MKKQNADRPQSRCRSALVAIVLFLLLGVGNRSSAQWTQWGGPNRNFTAETTGLADKWPEGGPKRLWHRGLGTGYSGIVVDEGVLYTMYRTAKEDEFEYTVALDTSTGKTLWQTKQSAAVPDSVEDYGKEYSGPNATPLVVDDRIYTVGRNAVLHCSSTTDGKVLWKHSLGSDFGAETHVCGFSSSPIAFGETIILPVGRVDDETPEGSSLVAFNQKSGEVVWKKHTFKSWHSSPILIDYKGEPQLVHCTNSALIGVDPSDGSLRWSFEYPDVTNFEGIWVTPVWDGKDTILFSSRRLGCAVQLTSEDSKTVAKQLWVKRNNALGMGTPVLLDDLLVGGKRGQNALFLGVDIRTGRNLWFERLFPGATLVGDRHKLVVLDTNGLLALVVANRDGLTTVSQYQVTERWSFTAPALVGTTLYVRDEKNIMAFDLSIDSNT